MSFEALVNGGPDCAPNGGQNQLSRFMKHLHEGGPAGEMLGDRVSLPSPSEMFVESRDAQR
jgi:hypothetical protein